MLRQSACMYAACEAVYACVSDKAELCRSLRKEKKKNSLHHNLQ